jgi:hypothetical protein
MLDFLTSLAPIISGKRLTLFSDGEDLKLFENRVLWRIFRTERKEITGDFRQVKSAMVCRPTLYKM